MNFFFIYIADEDSRDQRKMGNNNNDDSSKNKNDDDASETYSAEDDDDDLLAELAKAGNKNDDLLAELAKARNKDDDDLLAELAKTENDNDSDKDCRDFDNNSDQHHPEDADYDQQRHQCNNFEDNFSKFLFQFSRKDTCQAFIANVIYATINAEKKSQSLLASWHKLSLEKKNKKKEKELMQWRTCRMQIYKLLHKISKQQSKLFPQKRKFFTSFSQFRKKNVSSLL